MDRPDRFFLRVARPATRKQGARRFVVMRFHEELGKRRMRPVRTAVVQADLGIAGQFEGSCLLAMVDDCQRPHFCIDIWCDAYCPRDFDFFGATAEICPVSEKDVLSDICVSGKRLLADGPQRVVGGVSDVTELPPTISCDILPPPSNVKLPPGAPTGTCSSDHDAVATVGEQSDSGPRIHQVRSAIVSRRLGRAVAVN